MKPIASAARSGNIPKWKRVRLSNFAIRCSACARPQPRGRLTINPSSGRRSCDELPATQFAVSVIPYRLHNSGARLHFAIAEEYRVRFGERYNIV